MSNDSRELIRLAFENAKSTGRADWYRMDVGVLKNRILNLTNRSFRESDYGVPRFLEFVRDHRDILEIDETRRPPAVTLMGVCQESRSVSESAGTRVRADLWRAVMNFSGDVRYIWDNDECVAKPATDPAAEGLVMPTITAAQFTRWKEAFARSVDDTEHDARFEEWVKHLRPASFLATHVRLRWNEYLKKEVENHLIAWFEQQKLAPPPDLLETWHSGVPAPEEDLRRRLIACLRSMTMDELQRVQIPSSVLLRLKL